MSDGKRDFSGFFVTFEGGEGAGKTTLIEKLHTQFLQEGRQVVVTREPGGSLLGNQIRQWLLGHSEQMQISLLAELLLFLAARAQHLDELIRPALEEGKIVLCDRFNDSTIAYQGGARGLGIPYVQQLCDQVCKNTIPDVTIYLNISPEVGLKRRWDANRQQTAEGQFDRIENEKIDFHQRVQNAFLLLAKNHPHRIATIDATQTADHVFKTAYQIIKQKMG